MACHNGALKRFAIVKTTKKEKKQNKQIQKRFFLAKIQDINLKVSSTKVKKQSD